MNSIKCVIIIVLSIIGLLNYSAAEEVKIPAGKVEAFTVDSVTGRRTSLVFNNKSHRWEIPIGNIERAINPLAVKMPESFFVKDPTTGSIYPVRYEPYHEYVWARDDRSSQLKNPPVEFIVDYYLPGEYAPPGGWYYHIEVSPVQIAVSPTESQGLTLTSTGSEQPQSQPQWETTVFEGERQTGSGTDKDYDRRSGAINPRTGEHYPSTGKGVFDPKTGAYFPPTGSGFFNPKTGDYYPKIK